MEQLTIFYRIFHGDLLPTIVPPPEQKREHKEFLHHYSDMPGYPVPKEIELLPDHLLRFSYYKVLLHKMVKEIEAELYQSVFVRGENETKMRVEVIKLQRYIDMHLMKIRKNYIPQEQHQHILEFSEAKDAIDIYKLAYSSLVDLHEYLENSFSHYLDEHIVVPCKQRKRFILEQNKNAKKALNAVKNYEINSKLKEQVCSTIERFLSDGFNGFTYAQMHYCAKLNEMLNKYFRVHLLPNEHSFITLLVQLNFNRNGVFQYILQSIKVELATKETDYDRLEILSRYLKAINRIQHPSSFAYNEKLLSLREQLIDWLESKIHFISVQDIVANKPTRGIVKKSQAPIQKHKINLSVSESALLLNILTKANVVDVPRNALFGYFSTHFHTSKSLNVSTGSLDKKYDKPNGKSLRTVREVLQKCMTCLDEIEAKAV